MGCFSGAAQLLISLSQAVSRRVRMDFPELSLSKTSRQAASVPAGLISPVYLEYFQQTLVKNSVHDKLAGSSFRRFSE